MLFSLVFHETKSCHFKDSNTNKYRGSNNDLKRKGLSGRVETNDEMLFVFEREDYYGFWMKDMNFPIDIAWLDKIKDCMKQRLSKRIQKKNTKSFKPNSKFVCLETQANF